MEIVTGQELTELVDAAVHLDEPALDPVWPVGARPGPALVSEPPLRGRRRRGHTNLPEPKTTWVWDRTRQAWVEIIDSPDTDDPPGGDGVLAASTQTRLLPTPFPRRTLRPASSPRLRAMKSTLSRMINVLILRARSSHPPLSRATTTELVRTRETRLVARGRRDAGELARIIVDRAAKEARRTLLEATEQARELKGSAEREAERSSSSRVAEAEQLCRGIVRSTEEQAEARAESIVAKAEEKTKTQTALIITKAVETAEAVAVTVITDAGEKTRARAESIVTQAIERADAQARAIVARAEERARVQADRMVAATEEACRRRLSEAEAQVRLLVQAAASPTVETPAPPRAEVSLQETIDRARAQIPQTTSSQPARATGQPAPARKKGIPLPEEGRAELVIKHPVNIGRMQKMLNRLARYPEIRVTDLAGSPGKGVSVKLYSYRLARLISLLEALPEVDEVTQLPVKVNKICPGQRVCPSIGSGPPSARLLVTLARRDEILDV